jgi:hypothetical protein
MEPFVPIVNRELTKPKSPSFATEQRMRLKDGIIEDHISK